jgi:hydrogenase maturation protease
MLTVIGCGNLNRSDDGVGIEVVRRLASILGDKYAERVRIVDAGTDGMGVMFRARGATSLILVDACRSGSDAGAVFEVPGQELEGAPPHSFNLHDFRWDHALYAGRCIYKEEFPTNILVYLIESQDLGHGCGLSAAVDKAANLVVERLRRLIVPEMAVHE